ncbi:hypothetical protein [Streptomyces sp. JW3]|uniref:hypothetical protein n=1 Tax=Streptomyces sp. JW3 TaxID=3456955 RepID=UPI003FA43089
MSADGEGGQHQVGCDLDPFDCSTPAGITAFLDHLAGIKDQPRLLRSVPSRWPGGGDWPGRP